MPYTRVYTANEKNEKITANGQYFKNHFCTIDRCELLRVVSNILLYINC